MENPKIRFKMDNGLGYPHWRSKSFEEVFSPLNNNTFSRDMLNYEKGTAKNIHYGDILTNYGAICDVSSDVIPFVNGNIAYEKYDCLQNGDVILADTAEDETVGKAIELQGIKCETVISGLHTMACRPKQKYAPKYLGYLLNSPAFHNQLFPYMQGIKVTSIGRKNIASVKISYPCPAEQEKIADFLSSVDEVIIQSEKEVQNLEQQKKAMIQKIFSQELRFKNDDGTEFPEWKSDIVGNNIQLYEEKVCSETDLPVLTSSKNFGIEFQSEHFGREQNHDTEGYNILPKGYATYRNRSDNRDFTFNINTICEKGIISKFYPVFTSQDCNLQFLIYLLNNSNDTVKEIGYTAVGTGQKVLSVKDFQKVKIKVPCLKEQQKIADFLSAFEEAIDYAKQELEKWKELKKGLLQQMFV